MAIDCISRERMSEFLAGSLLPDDESHIADHLHACSDCNQLAFELSDDPVARSLLVATANHHNHRGGEASLVDLQRRLAALALVETAANDTTSQNSSETPSVPPQTVYAEYVSPNPPERLGKFAIIRELGAGGFGIVYLALDTVLNRHVALKLPRSIRLVDPGARPRFFREAQALARLDHPHIVPVYEAGEHEGTCYLAVAYCNGPTLDAWRRQQGRPIDPLTAAQILLILAEAVEHAHQHGILHRDIKPTNVLLTKAQGRGAREAGRSKVDEDLESSQPGTLDFGLWTPKLSDFGLAKMADDQRSSSTISGTVLGTPDYLSPEQAAGMIDKIGPPTDVYGLGAILYELLTGRPPLHGASTADTLRRVLVDEPKPLRDMVPSIPRDLEAITIRCLQKSPRLRYQSAIELHTDLQRFLDGQKVQAPSVKVSIFGPWQKNSWALVWGIAVPAALVALFCVASSALLVVPSKTPDAALVANVRSPSSSSASLPQFQDRKSEIENQKPAPSPIPAPPGLIAWWSGDGHARDYAGTNHGIPLHGATFAPGLVGKAFSLDGINDTIRVPNSDALNPTTGFTFECWIYPKSTAGWQKLISKWGDPDASYSFGKANDTDLLHFNLTESPPVRGNLLNLKGETRVVSFQWTHVAATYDNDVARIYFNGKLDAEVGIGPDHPIHVSKTDVLIGSNTGHCFCGLMDEVSLYDRALSAAEIGAIYRAGSAGKLKPTRAENTERPKSNPPILPVAIPAPPGLVAWWSGDGHTKDYGGTSDGTLENGATYAPGLVGQAFQLDGIDDCVRVPHHAALNFDSQLSIEGWIFCDRVDRWQHIVSKWNCLDDDWSYGLQQEPRRNLVRLLLSTSQLEDLASVYTRSPIADGEWTHLAATFDRNLVRFYINGDLNNEQRTKPGRRIRASATDVLIGASVGSPSLGPDCHFAGRIDELSLYNRALDEAEMQAIYRAGAAGKIKPANAAQLEH